MNTEQLKLKYVSAISEAEKEIRRENPSYIYLESWKRMVENAYQKLKKPNRKFEEEWKLHKDELTLKDTLWICDNDAVAEEGILITGINPSFNYSMEAASCPFTDCKGGQYWQTKHQMVDKLRISTAYLDLFPIRITSQADLMNDELIPIKLKTRLLAVTKQAIEDLRPSLIINPNKGSRFYWGIKPNTPWMGYRMVKQGNNPIVSSKQTDLYQIEGVLNHNEVIGERTTCLQGTKFLLAKYQSARVVGCQENLLNINDISKIL